MSMRIELVPLTTFQFQGAAGSTQEVQLVKYILTSRYISGVLEVRAVSRPGRAGQTIGLVLQPISMADDEPEATYVSTSHDVAATITDATLLPSLVMESLLRPVPSAYRLIVRAIQPMGESGAFSATLSASLTLRET